MSDKPGLKPRKYAIYALEQWENGKGFLSEMVDPYRELSEGERALAMDLCLGVCRQKSFLDYQIDRFCKQSPQPLLRQILRLGFYQILFMSQEIPSYSAVDTAVDLAAQEVNPSTRGFVNALLRRLLREGAAEIKAPQNKEWSIQYSHPEWLVKKWRQDLGDSATLKRLKSALELPPFWIRRNPQRMSLETWKSSTLHEASLWDRFGRTPIPLRQVLSSEEFKSGQISIQDPSSWLMTRLLHIKENDHHLLLDACAAPGGKSALLLEEFPHLKIISCDLKFHRLQKMEDLKNRLGLLPELCAQNALSPAFKTQSFDRILLDVPCSNLGVLGRRPEARWQVQEDDLAAQAALQSQILAATCHLLKKDGILVYGTCSPEPEETTLVIQNFLQSHPEFKLAEIPSTIPTEYIHQGMLRIIPQPKGFDGFFGAAIRRV